MRLRQAVWVAADLGSVSGELESALGVRDPFHDSGVGAFGLKNSVYAVGDTFLEVVSPVEENTAAGRYLKRLGGDGGYMLLVQVDDIADARSRAERLGVRIVWQADLPQISGTHLHPRDTGGTLLSLDWPDPPSSWHWAGPGWEERSVPGCLEAVEIQANEPHVVSRRWADILGREAIHGVIQLNQGTIRFVPADDGRGDCIAAIDLSVPGGTGREVSIGGVRVRLLPLES